MIGKNKKNKLHCDFLPVFIVNALCNSSGLLCVQAGDTHILSASPQTDRGTDVTSVARGAACPFCRRQISRPECQRVIGGRRGGDAKPNQRLALRHDHLAISLCQANRELKLAARCPRQRRRRRRADKSWSGGHDLFDRIHEKRSIRFQSASNVTRGGQFELLRCVKTSPFSGAFSLCTLGGKSLSLPSFIIV